jgi:hypothetical protein
MQPIFGYILAGLDMNMLRLVVFQAVDEKPKPSMRKTAGISFLTALLD